MRIKVASLADLPSACEKFVPLLQESRVVAFYGSMGAGKTTFIASLCRTLGVDEAVTSPTFALVNEYSSSTGPFPTIFHFDFYRIRDLSEAYGMGCEEYFESGALCLIEWPELVEPLLSEEVLRVEIVETPEGREIRIAE